jgi:hypothetical protein
VLVLAAACSERVDWNRKDAHRHCAAAIAGRVKAPCPALRMCANEAQLSVEQRTTLRERLREGSCATP